MSMWHLSHRAKFAPLPSHIVIAVRRLAHLTDFLGCATPMNDFAMSN